MNREYRDKIEALACQFFVSTGDLISVSSSIAEVVERRLEQNVRRAILEKGAAAINSFTDVELTWYGENIAPKVDAQIRSSRDTAAVGRLAPAPAVVNGCEYVLQPQIGPARNVVRREKKS